MDRARLGSVVLSLRGNDKGRIMMIIALESDFAWVCDGRKRRLERPKRKNLCHLRLLSPADVCLEVNAELTNKKLWRSLEPYRRTADTPCAGLQN